jgi:hypothetical protein
VTGIIGPLKLPGCSPIGLPLMVSATGSIPKIAEVASRYPGLRLVINHLGLEGSMRDGALGPALEPVLSLAPYANIAVKASALPCYVTKAYLFPSLHPHIRRMVEAFEPPRLFWGTDLTRLLSLPPGRHLVCRSARPPLRGRQGVDYRARHC